MAHALCVTLVAASISLPASVARADEATAADTIVARQLGLEGVKLANAGEWQAALEKLDRAEQLHHAPTILARKGECLLRLGRFVEAASVLDRVVHESLGPQPPHAFVVAQDRARELLAETATHLGTVRVDLAADLAGLATVMIDEENASRDVGLNRPVAVGHHVVRVSADAYEPFTAELNVRPNETIAVSVALKRRAESAPAPIAESRADVSAAPKPLAKRTVLPWIVLGSGAAATGAGVVFTLLASSAKSTLDSQCTNKVCAPASHSDYDNARTDATVATVAYSVAAALLITGGVLLFLRKDPARTGYLTTLEHGLTF